VSRKNTKPPVKSGKDESTIRNSPATRALHFLLGKQNENEPEQSSVLNPPVSTEDRSSISNEIKIDHSSGSIGAGSIEAGSDSRLRNDFKDESELSVSQLQQSQLHSSRLSESQQETVKLKHNHFEASPFNVNWRAVEHTRIPQVVFDEILPQLPPMAQMPYLQLLRLTLGFQRANCHISLESWASRCNQSLASIKRQAALLQQRGLLRKESVVFGGVARGSYFRPIIPGILNDDRIEVEKKRTSRLTESRLSASQLRKSQLSDGYMKRDHEDHGNETDHHQSRVMTIYEQLTGNLVTGADLSAYRKIAHLDADTIEMHMRQIYERSVEQIGSFAYFTKAVLKATEENQRTRAAQKRNLERIISRIRQNRTGARATLADLIEDIKRACARDNITYNNDLVNEILGL
jgi:hypothetical protein